MADKSELLPAEDTKARGNTLALLYQNVFTAIVRVQSGKQKLSDTASFRRRICAALDDIRHEGKAAGYSTRAIQDAEAAVVGFLDETVLSRPGVERDIWAKQPLALERNHGANAGEAFFERLEVLDADTDSPQGIDLLEVYLYCLLLGFEGRYSGSLRAQTLRIIDRLRKQVEAVRGNDYLLSSSFRYAAAPAPVQAPQTGNRWRIGFVAAIAIPLVLFLLYEFNLSLALADFRALLEQIRAA
jgi:type VI secretion system protein ImpK